MNRFFLILILVATSLLSCNQNVAVQKTDKVSDTYEKVITSKTIRVGYIAYPPGLIKEPNTSQLSGIFYETSKLLEKNTEIKFEYVEEISWADIIASLNSGKIDLVGSPVWPTSARGLYAEFTIPLYYDALRAYVRANDNRFDGKLRSINDPAVKICTIDGEISQIAAKADFPNAKEITNIKQTPLTQLLLDISQKKADVTFTTPAIALEFMKKNPGKIKEIKGIGAVRIYPNVMVMRKGDFKLKSMLDNAILELHNSGQIDKLIEKYEEYPGSFSKVQLPYRD